MIENYSYKFTSFAGEDYLFGDDCQMYFDEYQFGLSRRYFLDYGVSALASFLNNCETAKLKNLPKIQDDLDKFYTYDTDEFLAKFSIKESDYIQVAITLEVFRDHIGIIYKFENKIFLLMECGSEYGITNIVHVEIDFDKFVKMLKALCSDMQSSLGKNK
jgi:hypothetical protein